MKWYTIKKTNGGKEMKAKKSALWITRTAMFIALVLIAQFLTRGIPDPAGQFVTGSLVNLITILAILLCGLSSGVIVAALTPWFAFFLGIGPKIIGVVPCVMLGNIALVLVWFFIAGKSEKIMPRYIIAAVVAAVAKCLVLYFGVVKIVVGFLQMANETQAKVLSYMFSYPQLITALIGGVLAIVLAPLLKKALKISKNSK